MLLSLPRLLLCLCLAPAVSALGAGPQTQFSADKPVINFRLPAFTPEGNRAWLVRGSEARFATENRIEVKDLTLSVFNGLPDGKVDTLLLSPAAIVQPADAIITGPSTIRVIDNQFEASGLGWRYEHKDKKVSIAKHVRVVFTAEIKDLLK